MNKIERPKPGEYAAQHEVYVRAAKGEDLASALRHAAQEEDNVFAAVPKDRWEYRYAPGKWTTKEVFQHIIDVERVFVYLALAVARNDRNDLPNIDEDAYQAEARTEKRSIADVMRELRAVRQSTIELFEGLDDTALGRVGTVQGKRTTAPALGWIIAGHAEHHLRIVRERYLS
jgi:hypothetical protein